MAGTDRPMKITVTADGPYQVSGGVPLVKVEIVTNDDGESVGWRQTERLDAGDSYLLCRCGASSDKPFCDFTHAAIGFDGEETAGHDSYAELAVRIDGTGLDLHDVRTLCAEARFCDRGGGLWNIVGRCEDDETRALAVEEAELCPSGRYVAVDQSTGESSEPVFEPSIALIEDPHLGVSGPIFVRGRVAIVDADGAPYEVRNRVTLCRCGHSRNKPFCDGSHVEAEFKAEE